MPVADFAAIAQATATGHKKIDEGPPKAPPQEPSQK
jgi:hypothetical protein